MGNNVLSLSPPIRSVTEPISINGSVWLWAVFFLFGMSLLTMTVLNFMRPRGTRLFHELALVIIAVSCVSYFSIASDLGATPISVEANGNRQIWYVRYIQWFVTLPLLLLELLLSTGLSLSDVTITLSMAIVLVASALAGALVSSTYKWGCFTSGISALCYIFYVLLWHAPLTIFAAGGVFRTIYVRLAGFLSFMLISYPITWACAEGASVISPTSEMIWYGVLDILIGPVFLFAIVWHQRDVDYTGFRNEVGEVHRGREREAYPSCVKYSTH